MILSRQTLDNTPCHNPDCTEGHSTLILEAICHPGGGLRCEYHKDDGIAMMFCIVCRSQVATLQIAERVG